ncbi:glycoside hydrolase family 28 protein [Sphaerobolus stellatus SS14]|nr:glycoside hydrolase family 28 protein [Sphaerobolus stellatus SS14]
MLPIRITGSLLTVFLLTLLRSTAGFVTCNVLDYSAVADNFTDLAAALTSAWNNCVKAHATSTATDTLLFVPAGNFLTKSTVTFNRAQDRNLHITGNIYLPFNPSMTGTMFTFQNCNNILLNGPSAIYGNGYRYRPGGNLTMYPSRPRFIRFQDCNNCEITSVILYDSLLFHITIIGNNNVAHNLGIRATHIGETDGFNVSGKNNVENGDECVTVKMHTNGFRAENIDCRSTADCNLGSYGSGATGVSIQMFPTRM